MPVPSGRASVGVSDTRGAQRRHARDPPTMTGPTSTRFFRHDPVTSPHRVIQAKMLVNDQAAAELSHSMAHFYRGQVT